MRAKQKKKKIVVFIQCKQLHMRYTPAHKIFFVMEKAHGRTASSFDTRITTHFFITTLSVNVVLFAEMSSRSFFFFLLFRVCPIHFIFILFHIMKYQ